jgi:hypothetical protein
MKIAELDALPNCQSVAVDNKTGHAIAIVRAEEGGYHLYDGNSMATPYCTQIKHPDGKGAYSIDEVREMFSSGNLSSLTGFLPG